MPVKLSNNAVSSLAASITSGANQLSIQTADAGLFPALAAGEWHPATIKDSSNNMEIVRVTARAGDVLTIVRAQEGTTAKAFTAGSIVSIRVTAAIFADYNASIKDIEEDATNLAQQVNELDTEVGEALALKAPLSSPEFEDEPTAPTADAADDSDRLSTTKFVARAVKVVADKLDALDFWEFQPPGSLVMDDGTPGFVPPPTDKTYRYVELTAGLTGAGQYNNGILTTEVVSGSAPLVSATAVISLAGSPFNGRTIHLINTERRMIRPGAAGTLQDDAMQGHRHTVFAFNVGNTAGGTQFQAATAAPSGAPTTDPISDGTNGAPRTANETRVRNIGARFFKRIL